MLRIIVTLHSLVDREMHTRLPLDLGEDKAHHRQTTAGGGAYRDRSRGMRASSRASSDLRVILQVRSSSWQLVAALKPFPAALNPMPIERNNRREEGSR